MSELGDVLQDLKAFGLLDRALKVKVGEIEVLMDGVPVAGEATDAQPQKAISAEEERRIYAEKMYGASQGGVPGLPG